MTGAFTILSTVEELLGQHRGAARAITGRDLAGMLRQRFPKMAMNTAMRRVQESVVAMRETGAMVLATSHEECPGYFLAQTAAEVRRFLRELDQRAESEARTRRWARKWLLELEQQAAGQLALIRRTA